MKPRHSDVPCNPLRLASLRSWRGAGDPRPMISESSKYTTLRQYTFALSVGSGTLSLLHNPLCLARSVALELGIPKSKRRAFPAVHLRSSSTALFYRYYSVESTTGGSQQIDQYALSHSPQHRLLAIFAYQSYSWSGFHHPASRLSGGPGGSSHAGNTRGHSLTVVKSPDSISSTWKSYMSTNDCGGEVFAFQFTSLTADPNQIPQ